MKYLILVTVFVLASAASADVLFGAQANPDDVTNGTGIMGIWTVGDDFTLEPAAGGTVETIDWWLTGNDCGSASSQFTITFLTEEGGLPGDTLWFKTLYPSEFVYVGPVGASGQLWHVTFNLDPSDYLTLSGSTVYCASIHYTGPEYAVYSATVYDGGYEDYFINDEDAWYDGNLNYVIFELSGTIGSSALGRNTWGAIKSFY